MATASIIYQLSLLSLHLTFASTDEEVIKEKHHWIITDCREFIDLDEDANL